jgi:hypothetical protein
MISSLGKVAALQRIVGLRRRVKPAHWKQVPSHVKQADAPPTVELFSQPRVLELPWQLPSGENQVGVAYGEFGQHRYSQPLPCRLNYVSLLMKARLTQVKSSTILIKYYNMYGGRNDALRHDSEGTGHNSKGDS